MTDFQWNVDLDPALFSTEMPANYTVQHEEIVSSEPKEFHLLGALVFPQGAHIHEGGEEEHHCHLCHENWAARVDEKNLCPRCELHPEERTESGIP